MAGFSLSCEWVGVIYTLVILLPLTAVAISDRERLRDSLKSRQSS